MAPEDTNYPIDDQPVEETMLFPLPAPSYDEERGSGIGDQQFYEQDFSRLGRAYTGRRAQEIPIPHMSDEDGSGYRIPGEGRSRGALRPLLALFLVVTMAACIYAAATYGLEVWGGKSLPNVVGISEVSARTILEEEGYQVITKSRIADDGIGFVIEQEPASGERVEEGINVTIVVAVSRTMPEVAGMTQQEAFDLLTEVGAEKIEVVGTDSSESEGTVLSVKPEPGEPFSAYQTVTLTVAQKPLVPNVIGKDKVEAKALVDAAGFKGEYWYVTEEGAPNSVIKTEPDPEAKADPGSTVWLYVVEPMPTEPLHMLEYFGKNSSSIAKYLNNNGFYLQSSFVSSDNEAEAVYYSDSYGNLCFCNRPYSHSYIYSRDTGEDVLADGHPFVGIRWEVPTSLLPSDASKLNEDAARDIMTRCGLSSISDVCTHKDIQMPNDMAKTNAKFSCTYGEVGGVSWTVLLVSEANGDLRAVVTCAPTTYYTSNYDLKDYGNSICDFVAAMDVYNEL